MVAWGRSASVLLGAAAMLSIGAVGGAGTPPASQPAVTPSVEDNVTQGALRVKQKDGSIVECPLKHTDVKADVSGFIARVKVTQTFSNPYDEPIEAVYVFPLPNEAAVDDMTMVIGTRRIVATIQRRSEARQIYEAAVAAGTTAALLEQERPNIFTQSVGNIPAKQDVNVEISYVDVLKYDMGVYTFHFPMVVGPRYIPGGATTGVAPLPPELQGKTGTVLAPPGPVPSGTGWAPDTTRVPDASRITPPVLKPGFRTGHDISLSVNLDAGVPIQDIKITNHKADLKRDGNSRANAVLSAENSIPNKDFVMEYGVVGQKPEMALLCHAPKEAAGRGYFMLMVQPKDDEALKQAPPREMFFLVDVSGSMQGQPIAKSKEAMRVFFRLAKKDDRMQVIAFASNAKELWETPQAIDDKTISQALAYVDKQEGSGGTEMLKGIKKVLDAPPDPKRVRIVVMLTDGFIGNEAEIIKEVGLRAGDRIRFWTIGIGSSPNRFLLDGVAKQGGGMSKVLGLNDKPDEMVQEIVMRIHRAQLADVKIDWAGLAIEETYPAKIPELWAGRPLILFGRYETGGDATIQVKGNVEGQAVAWPLHVNLAKEEPGHDVLAKVWARNKIEALMDQSYYQDPPEVVEQVTKVALEYKLMSQYTSFVAVDTANVPLERPAKPPRRMVVPVPLPEGVSYAGVFGAPGEMAAMDMELTDRAISGGDAGYLARSSPSAAAAPARMRSPSPLIAGADAKPRSGPGGFYSYFEKDAQGQPGGRPMKEMRAGRASGPQGGGHGGFGGSGGLAYELERRESKRLGEAGAYIPPAPTTRPVAEAGDYRVYQAFVKDAAKRQEAATKALDEAVELQKKSDLRGAWARYQAAFLLDVNGDVSDKAEAALADLAPKIEAEAVKALPGLGKKLDLVIRDRSLEETLKDIAAASGVTVAVKPGSLADARTLLQETDLRVTYLDLRRATVTQALTWLLNPYYLTWQVDGKTAQVISARRMDGAQPWTYDVTLLAVPLQAEYAGDQAKAAKAADDFLAAVQAVDPGATWLGTGQLLVVGTPKVHESVAALVAALGDSGKDVMTSVPNCTDAQKALLKSVQVEAAKRVAARKELVAPYLAARHRAEVLGTLVASSWSLLAQASTGAVEDETVTELAVAWRDPRMAEYDRDPQAAAVIVRSFWIATESAAAVKDAALQAMATNAKTAAAPAIETVVTTLEKDAKNGAAYLGALYARLAVADPRAVKAMDAAKDNPWATAMKAVLAALFAKTDDAGRAALTDVLIKGVQGPDSLLLTALAARRAGGDVWTQFRVGAKGDPLGNQPLPGGVVVTVNSLATANLPSAKRAA